MKGRDFLDYEGLTKYHDRLVEVINGEVEATRKHIDRTTDELLYNGINPISETVQQMSKAISGILNVFHDNITWQDE